MVFFKIKRQKKKSSNITIIVSFTILVKRTIIVRFCVSETPDTELYTRLYGVE